MCDYKLELLCKNAFREIPEGKLNAILTGMNSIEKQDRIQAVVLAISEGCKYGFNKGVEDEQIKRNINRNKRRKSL